MIFVLKNYKEVTVTYNMLRRTISYIPCNLFCSHEGVVRDLDLRRLLGEKSAYYYACAWNVPWRVRSLKARENQIIS